MDNVDDPNRNKRRSFNEMLKDEEMEAAEAQAPVGVAQAEPPPAYPPMKPAEAYPAMPAEEENLRQGLERKALPSAKKPPSGKHVALNPLSKKKNGSPMGPVLVTVVLLLAGAFAFWLGASSGGGSDLPSAGITEETTPQETPSPEASAPTPEATTTVAVSTPQETPAPQASETAAADPFQPASPSATETPEASPTVAVTPRPTATETPEASATVAMTPKPTATETPKASPTVAMTPKPTATKTPKPSATVAVTPKPSPSKIPKPSATVAMNPKPTPTRSPETPRPSGAFSVNVKSNVKDSKILLYRDKERLTGASSVKPTSGGTYTLKVTAPGYQPYVKQIKVTGTHNLAVYLKPEPQPAYQPPPPSYNPGSYDPGPAYYPPPSGSGGGSGGGYEIPSGGL